MRSWVLTLDLLLIRAVGFRVQGLELQGSAFKI